MLRPYTSPYEHPKTSSNLPSHIATSNTGPNQPRMRKPIKVIGFLFVMFALSSDVVFNPLEQFFKHSRSLCAYFLGDLDEDSFWMDAFPALATYLPTDVTALPPGDIGFVITLDSCPEDAGNVAGFQVHPDPGHSLYDAAAVLKYSIEKNLNVTGMYTATMHAIIHPDAIFCTTPNGDLYDRARVLESLGYRVKIKGSPLIDSSGDMVPMADPVVADNVNNDAGVRDLISLYATDIPDQQALILTDVNNVFPTAAPLDPVINDFINSPQATIAFTAVPQPTTPVILTVAPSRAPVTPAPVAPTNAPVTPKPTTAPPTPSPTTAPPTNAPVTRSPTPAPTPGPPTLAPVPQLTPLTTAAATGELTGTTPDMNSIVLLKPDPGLTQTITDLYTNTTFDPTNGWNNSGLGVYQGALGTAGILDYYYKMVEPNKAMIIDKCKYGSSDPSCPPEQGVTVANMAKCGAPWTCPDLSGLTAAEQAKCKQFAQYWYEARMGFEDECFYYAPVTNRNGTFNPDYTLGMCSEEGKVGYERLMQDATCNKQTKESTDEKKITYSSSDDEGNRVTKEQDQKVTTSCGKSTAKKETCLSCKIEVPRIAYNIALVIDNSNSMCLDYAGGPKQGDANNDNKKDTLLDAELYASLGLLESICGERELGNDNVTIGLINFNSQATYHGMYLPCSTSNPSLVNPTLRASIQALQCGGNSYYNDALAKSIMFYQEAPLDRVNTMFFMSDGKPSYPGVTEAQQNLNWVNPAPASTYAAELAVLNQFEVHRVCVAPGSGADVRHGMDLALIDNTPEGPESGAMTKVLIQNPVVGKIVNFQVIVNDKGKDLFPESLIGTPIGYELKETQISGLKCNYGETNRVVLRVVMDADGDPNTTHDQNILESEMYIPGALQ